MCKHQCPPQAEKSGVWWPQWGLWVQKIRRVRSYKASHKGIPVDLNGRQIVGIYSTTAGI